MIVASKTIGENFDIIIVDQDPLSVAVDACEGCKIIYHDGLHAHWYMKLTDGENTDVTMISTHNNYNATTNPGVTDDIAAGYEIGSEWLNTSTGKWLKCRSNASGAAVWDLLN